MVYCLELVHFLTQSRDERPKHGPKLRYLIPGGVKAKRQTSYPVWHTMFPLIPCLIHIFVSGEAGQSKWPYFFPECGGSSQSPVNLDSLHAWYDPSLPTLRLMGYDQYGHEPFRLLNNGHTGNIPIVSIHPTHTFIDSHTPEHNN